MKFIITGHKGLIGSALFNRLSEEGHTCPLAIDFKDGYDVREINNYQIKADVMIHCAANVKINKMIDYPWKAKENVDNTYEVLEYCRVNKIPKIVFFSSSRVLSEERNPYTAGKIYGEELCKAYQKCYGIDYLIIRPSTVYGLGRDDSNRLMQIWLDNARKGEDLIIYGTPSKTLSFTYIDDFIDAVMWVLPHKNKEFNFTGKQEYLIEVAGEIIDQVNKESFKECYIIFEDQELEQPQQVNFKSDLPCTTSIEEGIRRCLEYDK